jgi:LacI family transcriptional regulator
VPGRFKKLRTEQAVMCLPIQLVVQQEIRKFRIVIFLLGAAENTKVAAVINAIFLDPPIIGQFDNDDNVELFRQNGIIAIAQDYKSRFSNIPNITGDYRNTGKMAAEFFLSKGFQNFAFYGYRDTVWSQERCEGFYECIAAHGFGNNFSSYQEQSLDDLWFYEAPPLLNWLKSLPQPTALMACDDNQGNRITEICKVNNIRVPDKIAILGVDNDEIICNLSDPPLSSINHNIVRGGFEAAALIEHLLNNEEATYQDVVLQPVNIINRLSTDFYSTTDTRIHKVLKYIHQNLSNDITVSDIVKEVPLSRRLLEIRFKEVTKQSIHKYIFNLRMERFAQLLLASDDPIADVAEQVGITNLKNLSRQFKALKQVSPNEYRKEHKMKNRL